MLIGIDATAVSVTAKDVAVLTTYGSVVRDLRIDVLAGRRVLGSARGTSVRFPPEPPVASGCACSHTLTLVVLDPHTRQLIVRTVPP